VVGAREVGALREMPARLPWLAAHDQPVQAPQLADRLPDLPVSASTRWRRARHEVCLEPPEGCHVMIDGMTTSTLDVFMLDYSHHRAGTTATPTEVGGRSISSSQQPETAELDWTVQTRRSLPTGATGRPSVVC